MCDLCLLQTCSLDDQFNELFKDAAKELREQLESDLGEGHEDDDVIVAEYHSGDETKTAASSDEDEKEEEEEHVTKVTTTTASPSAGVFNLFQIFSLMTQWEC